MVLANTKVKTLLKNQQQKHQRKNSKHKQVQPKGKISAANAVELNEAPEQPSAYESYYKQVSEEVESVERHVRELRQTPGLEHLTETEAQAQIEFMLRFSAWVFNQHLQGQDLETIEDEAELMPKPAKVSKAQKPKRQRNKKVTESLSR